MDLGCCNPYSGSGSGGGSGPTGPAGPTWFSFGIQGPIGDGTNSWEYYPPPGSYVPNVDEVSAIALTDFTVTGMQVHLKGDFKNMGATMVITFRVEGVDTALTLTLAAGSFSGSVTANVPVTAGQHYSISITGDLVSDYPDNLIGQIYYTT